MKILVFDTSFEACSVAVIEAGGNARANIAESVPAIASCYEPMVTGQAVRLMPMISEVMASAGLSFSNIDGIATSNGPGTFTGVRIAVATARALAVARELPVFGFSSLALVAAKALGVHRDAFAGGNEPIAVCMDARRDEQYVQLFSSTNCEAQAPPQLLSPKAAVAFCGESVIAVGTGAAIYCEAAALLNQPARAGLGDLQPDATFSMGVLMDRFEPLSPLYLRRPDAKPPSSKTNLRVSQ